MATKQKNISNSRKHQLCHSDRKKPSALKKQSLNDYVILHMICSTMNSKTRRDKINKIFQDKQDVLDKFSKNVTVRMDTLRADLIIATSIMNQDFDKKSLSELISLRTDLRKDILAQIHNKEEIKNCIQFLNKLKSENLFMENCNGPEIPSTKILTNNFTLRNELQNVEMATRDIQIQISQHEDSV